jgi:hypothetical protein
MLLSFDFNFKSFESVNEKYKAMMLKKIQLLYCLFFMMLLLINMDSEGKSKSLNNVSQPLKDNLTRQYITPVRIVWKSDESKKYIINSEKLLKQGNGQADLVGADLCLMNGGDKVNTAILLDFGKEINGGIQIVTGAFAVQLPIKVRITLGESVSEAMSSTPGSTATNDHAMRDFETSLPWLGSIETGNSGFRFAKIELLDSERELKIKEIRAISVLRDIPYLGSFKSNDERLNQIWQTGAYTVHLNMQDYLWDGIKRDRLVWVGDLHPEVMTVNAVFGYNEVVPKSLDLIRDITPVTEWMNGISSYSMWWVIIHKEWYYNHGNLEYLEQQKPYLTSLLNKFCSMIDENGKEHLDGHRFLDWPSSPFPKAVDAGYHSLLKMTLEAGSELCDVLKEKETFALCKTKIKLLEKQSPYHDNSKQAAALLTLSNSITPQIGNVVISNEGAKRFSTFYGYYMLQAMAMDGNYSGAIDIIREYWGGMLQLGATTFWEDFNIDWMKNAGRIDELPSNEKVDVHSTYGDYCYVGLRHSFCHGWASGPTSWLSEYVLGIKILSPGCKEIAIEPHLGDLEWVEGTYPTPLGIIKVRHEKLPNGKIKSDIKVPKGIKVIK